MYKTILHTLFSLSISPVTSWAELDTEADIDNKSFLDKFLYPVIGFTTLATFLGKLFYSKGYDIEYALKSASVTFVSLFAGFFLAAFVLNEAMKFFFRRDDNIVKCRLFVGYVSCCCYMITTLLAILPELFFLKFALLYVLYIIWVGSDKFMGIGEKARIKFLILSTAIIVASPYMVEKVMLMLMPGLSIR